MPSSLWNQCCSTTIFWAWLTVHNHDLRSLEVFFSFFKRQGALDIAYAQTLKHNSPSAFPGECNVDKSLWIHCGHQSISSDACNKLGCCYDAYALTCFYKLNGKCGNSPTYEAVLQLIYEETINMQNTLQPVFSLYPACSLDGHFVFTVKATDTHPPIDPSSLVIKDQPHCLPVVTTPDMAVFKIGVMECGAKMKVMQLWFQNCIIQLPGWCTISSNIV